MVVLNCSLPAWKQSIYGLKNYKIYFQWILKQIEQWGEISCQFLPTGGSMGLRFVLQLFKSEKSQNYWISTATKAIEKNKQRLRILNMLKKFLMYVWPNLTTIKFYFINLATDFHWLQSNLQGERSSSARFLLKGCQKYFRSNVDWIFLCNAPYEEISKSADWTQWYKTFYICNLPMFALS
jgi:hypothetical protein